LGRSGTGGTKRSGAQAEFRSDPFHRLSIRPFCDDPDVEGLTLEQQFALHEFLHTLLAAGFKLYQTVPVEKAMPLIRKKFAMMIDEH
jgi:hypothetical protein